MFLHIFNAFFITNSHYRNIFVLNVTHKSICRNRQGLNMIRVWVSNLNQWDSALCVRVFRLNGKGILDRLMILFSRLGDGYLYGVMALLVILFDWTTAKVFLPAAGVAFAIELISHGILKKSVRRNRPFERLSEIRQLIKPPDQFSFPSGHTAAAFVMALLLSHFYPSTTALWFGFAGTIGFSRVYNGVHYPGDVFVGMLLGLASGKIALILMVV